MLRRDKAFVACQVRHLAMELERPVAREPAQRHIEHRRQEQAERSHADHPGEHRHAHGRAHLGAGTRGQHQRQHTHDECKRGHQDRAQAQPARFHGGLERRPAGKFQLARELDDQDRVLRRQPHQHHQPDLGEHVAVAAGDPHAGHRGQDAHRHDQDDGQRQREALVLRRQHQEHQQDGQREHDDGGVAGQDLLVGQVGPFELDALGQGLCGDPLDGVLRLAGRIAGRRATVDVGSEIPVVAHRTLRPEAGVHFHQCGQRHHLARGGAHLQQADVLRPGAVRRIRLHPHAVGPAELVEVVRIQAAQVDLHGVEDVLHRHAELARLGAVDVRVELRHIDLPAGEHAGQLRRLHRLAHESLHCSVHCLVAHRAPVLQLELEATGGAQALHGRRREHDDEGVLDLGELRVELLGDSAPALVGPLALIERLEHCKGDAGVRAVGEAVDRQAREGQRPFDVRVLRHDVAHAADHLVRAVQRGAVGQLGKADQVLLVLARHEAVGHGLEQAEGQADQREVQRHHQRLARQHPAHAAAVGLRAAMEEPVEATEEPSEGAVHAAGQRILGRIVALEQQRRECRRQRQRVDGRDHGGDRDGHRELPIELAGEPADEGQRNEHGHQRERDGDDGPGHFPHRTVGGIAWRQARLDVALHVLHHHDGVVHHDADGQHQPEKRERIDREAQQVQHREGADDGHRHRQQRNDGSAPGLQEQDDHQHDQRDGFEQCVHHGIDGGAHELRRVVGDAVLQPFGHELRQLVHRLAHIGGDLQRVGTRRLEHADAHGLLVVQQRAQCVLGGAELDAADVAQPGHRAFRAGLDDDVAEFLFALQAPLRVDRQLRVHARQPGRSAHHACSGLDVLAANGRHHVAGRQAALRHLLRVQPDAHGVLAAAPGLHLADAVDARQPVLDVEHRVVAQVIHVVAPVGRHQVNHHRDVGRALDGGDPQPPHFLGQARLGLRHAVLHHLLRLVRVGAQLEGDGQRHHAIRGRLAAHVEHVLDAVDLLLERRRHRLGNHLRIGARILGAHHHRRGCDFRVFRDRQPAQGDQARDQHQQREHAREDRPIDEEFR
ncbi:hypothetical protein APY03_3954 [Variovorax sp. WDL1]|nr:hypothetical protein APY03_3954 [Variovorax sp. WDL1]